MTSTSESPVRKSTDCVVSIVIPAYNESGILGQLFSELDTAMKSLDCKAEVVIVNDGSKDDSALKLDRFAENDSRIRVVHLSRNFGHQSALLAGLAHARGDAILVMDADLQDDPIAIGRFVEKWREGYDVVYAIRVGRKEGPIKRFCFYSFYRVFNAVSQTPIPMDAGNFGLIDARVAKEIVNLSDRDRYYPGLRRWVGFRQIGIPIERRDRADGKPKVSSIGLFRLAKTAIFSFSRLPLSMFYVIAAFGLVAFLFLCCFTLYFKLFTELAAPGWTSTLTVASFFGALNALGIAILGEYVSRIYDQVRNRPVFLVERTVNLEPQTGTNRALGSSKEE